MQEARGSWNGYYKSAAGNKEQFTLRQEDGQKDEDFVLRVKQFDKTLGANGWKPLAAQQESNHPRWVIKGGNFKKFGITCWPETLEASGIYDKLDPLKDNAPKGDWIAFYVESKNDEGKMVPDKVTKLVRKDKVAK